MRIDKKNNKGEYEYLREKKKLEVLKTILFFGISLAILIMGYVSTGSKSNYLTIVAVLGMLPASKSAVSMFMYLKMKGCSDTVRQQLTDTFGHKVGVYNLCFTSYDKNYEISHMYVKGMTVIAFTENSKIVENAFEDHIKNVLNHDAIKGVNVKLYKDIDKYLMRIEQMQKLETEHNKEGAILKTLFSVSL